MDLRLLLLLLSWLRGGESGAGAGLRSCVHGKQLCLSTPKCAAALTELNRACGELGPVCDREHSLSQCHRALLALHHSVAFRGASDCWCHEFYGPVRECEAFRRRVFHHQCIARIRDVTAPAPPTGLPGYTKPLENFDSKGRKTPTFPPGPRPARPPTLIPMPPPYTPPEPRQRPSDFKGSPNWSQGASDPRTPIGGRTSSKGGYYPGPRSGPERTSDSDGFPSGGTHSRTEPIWPSSGKESEDQTPDSGSSDPRSPGKNQGPIAGSIPGRPGPGRTSGSDSERSSTGADPNWSEGSTAASELSPTTGSEPSRSGPAPPHARGSKPDSEAADLRPGELDPQTPGGSSVSGTRTDSRQGPAPTLVSGSTVTGEESKTAEGPKPPHTAGSSEPIIGPGTDQGPAPPLVNGPKATGNEEVSERDGPASTHASGSSATDIKPGTDGGPAPPHARGSIDPAPKPGSKEGPSPPQTHSSPGLRPGQASSGSLAPSQPDSLGPLGSDPSDPRHSWATDRVTTAMATTQASPVTPNWRPPVLTVPGLTPVTTAKPPMPTAAVPITTRGRINVRLRTTQIPSPSEAVLATPAVVLPTRPALPPTVSLMRKNALEVSMVDPTVTRDETHKIRHEHHKGARLKGTRDVSENSELPSCSHAFHGICQRHVVCRRVWEMFRTQCAVDGNNRCLMTSPNDCWQAFEGISWTGLGNCTCRPDDSSDCHWIRLQTSHNKCIWELMQANPALKKRINGRLALPSPENPYVPPKDYGPNVPSIPVPSGPLPGPQTPFKPSASGGSGVFQQPPPPPPSQGGLRPLPGSRPKPGGQSSGSQGQGSPSTQYGPQLPKPPTLPEAGPRPPPPQAGYPEPGSVDFGDEGAMDPAAPTVPSAISVKPAMGPGTDLYTPGSI